MIKEYIYSRYSSLNQNTANTVITYLQAIKQNYDAITNELFLMIKYNKEMNSTLYTINAEYLSLLNSYIYKISNVYEFFYEKVNSKGVLSLLSCSKLIYNPSNRFRR